ncbi:App1 family protein [Agrococcus casei]|uniref:Phosphatidate phosphatase APP1 catalytic domain-containing protein n=1 Tax=Agrococcus casei LMG 22410 TaxID=1255656 RepID=A0A1R4FNF6_9MICO|nr:phosphatase domain-containing protein [Agrococcus casei]SJM57317.1 hypothetical protein CZ674_05425 [Agrococcus casei LMG 22410]
MATNSSPLDYLPKPLLHRAAKVEDWIHEFREARALRSGRIPAIIAYPGYGGDGWARVLCRVLLVRHGEENQALYEDVRGWRSFTSIALNHVDVTVSHNGESHVVTADRGGVVDAVVPFSLEPGWNTLKVSTSGSAPVDAPVFVVDPECRIGVISDVDDTVMVTLLPRPMLAAWNAFVLDEHARRPVPGMAVLYERIKNAHPSAPFIYLSTGAWNVAPTLSRFLSRNLYPAGPLLLTDWGPTHDRFFRSGKDHKEQNLARLAEEFPNMRWILVGDDGQHDEQIYGAFAKHHPEHVAAVAIRELSPQEAVLAGGRKSQPHDDGTIWVWAPNGGGLASELSRQVPETAI